MATATHTTRRSLFAIAAGAALLPALPATASAFHPGHDWFLTEARELIVMTAQVNAGAAEPFCDAWAKRIDDFLTKVEGLPLQPENAAIKALAITVIHCDEPLEWTTEGAMDTRLAGQIVQCLTGGLN